MIEERYRTLSARAELVDADGNAVEVQVGKSAPRTDLPLSSAKVSFKGETAEQWSASLTFSDPWMVPTDPTHPLWGAQNLAVRLWWRVMLTPESPAVAGLYPSESLYPGDGLYPADPVAAVDATWEDHLVCTVAIGDSAATDTGTISGTVRGRDMLSLARGGWGGPLDLGGLTVAQAIRAIFERVAPTLPLRIAETNVTLPAVYDVGEDDPARTWTDVAGLAGWVVRTDRDGVIVAGPRPQPAPSLDWSEGPDCPVTEIRWEHRVETMGNRITVRSTHPDHVGVYATVQDNDPSSPTWVGGPWGIHPLPDIESDAVASVASAENLARMHLGRGLRPVEDVEVTIPQRPDLTYRQPVHLARAQLGVGGVYEISSWDMELPVPGKPPAPMVVRMMQRTVSV